MNLPGTNALRFLAIKEFPIEERLRLQFRTEVFNLFNTPNFGNAVSLRPQGQSELYSYKEDPQERNNLFGEAGSAAIQSELQQKLLDHYLQTTGIAPMDKDPRGVPPFYPTNPGLTPPEWQRSILDKG